MSEPRIDCTDLNLGAGVEVLDGRLSVCVEVAAQVTGRALPKNCGFIIVAMPLGAPPDQGIARYSGNVNREDAVAILKTLLFRWGINEEWMKQAE